MAGRFKRDVLIENSSWELRAGDANGWGNSIDP
jgi:hypothetical protein